MSSPQRGRPATDAEDRLYRQALGWLAEADFTRFEIRAALARDPASADCVQRILDRLDADRLLDDRRLARRHVRKRSARHRGPARIRMELRARGVDDATIEACLAEIPSAEWRRYAAELLDHSYLNPRRGRPRPPHDPHRFLTLRGFEPADIEAVVSATLPAELLPD